MPYVPQHAIELFIAGGGTEDVVSRKIKTLNGDPASDRTARRWRRYWLEGVADPRSDFAGIEVEVNNDEINRIVKMATNKFISLREISTAIDRSEASIEGMIATMQAQGINIEMRNNEAHFSSKRSVLPIDKLKDPIADAMHMKFAIASDWHVGSNFEQITHRYNFYRWAREQGYDKMLVPGDLTEGLDMRVGHELGMYVHSVDALDARLEEDFRLLDELGYDVYVIGGNHDAPIIRKHKTDIVWRACKRWDNVKFLGYDKFDLPITDKFSIRMWHPDGGAGENPTNRIIKAMRSLHIEDMIELLSDEIDEEGLMGTNVKGVVGGHFHIYTTLQYGNLFGMLVPSFQGQTDYLDRKPLTAMTGGTLLDVWLNDAGDVLRWGSQMLPYRPIKNDHLNYVMPECSMPDLVEIMVRVGEPEFAAS